MFERRGRTDRSRERVDVEHLRAFAALHTGVEAYLEPATPTTGVTVVLVAGTGEWTRRRIGGHLAARDLARRCAIPLYDAQLLGYPARMRAWNGHRASPRPATPGLGVPSGRSGPEPGLAR